MTKNAVKTYDAKYDVLKLVLSVMVVAIHTCIYPMLLFPWLRVAVPLFFMMSSYFLFAKLQNNQAGKQWEMIKKYMIRNMKLYLFWSMALLPTTLYIRRESYFSQGMWQGISGYICDFLKGDGFEAAWFIPATVIGVMIIWLLSQKRKTLTVCLITVLVFCGVTLWSSYQPILQNDSIVMKVMKGYSSVLGNPAISFPVALFWIFIGKCFVENRIKTFSWPMSILFLLLSAVALYAEWKFVYKLDGSYNNDSYFMLAPMCISFFSCIQKIKIVPFRCAIFARQVSTVIYVTHVTLMVVVGFIYREMFHIDSKLAVFVTIFPCCLLIFGAINWICNRCKNHKIIALLKCSY